MIKPKKRYAIYSIKNCSGRVELYYRSSTDDINGAYQRIEETYRRIKDTGRHTQSYRCWGDAYGWKCKMKLEVQERQQSGDVS